METSTDNWVKPFSTGMSCVDTVTGECLRGLSADECAQFCDDHDMCAYGYHVKLPNEKKSYCVPLNNLPYMDNTNLFYSSRYSKDGARLFSPNIGVEMTTFYNPEVLQFNKIRNTELSQLSTYYLRYHPDITNSSEKDNRNANRTLYLQKDLVSWKTSRDTAAIVLLYRDQVVMSAVNTRDPRIRNGNLIFVNVLEKNLIYVFINENVFGFYPNSIRSSSSVTYDVTNLYHTQIVTKYPFNNDSITSGDVFAIRIGTIPIVDHVYYWTLDPSTNIIVNEKMNVSELNDLERFLKFSVEKVTEIDPDNAENFLSSQVSYMLSNYYYPQSDTFDYKLETGENTKNVISIIVVIGAVLLLAILLVILWRKKLF